MVMAKHPDQEHWREQLNNLAAEMGLERSVKTVQDPTYVSAVAWVYEKGDGEQIALGYSVEDAESTLRVMAGQGE